MLSKINTKLIDLKILESFLSRLIWIGLQIIKMIVNSTAGNAKQWIRYKRKYLSKALMIIMCYPNALLKINRKMNKTAVQLLQFNSSASTILLNIWIILQNFYDNEQEKQIQYSITVNESNLLSNTLLTTFMFLIKTPIYKYVVNSYVLFYIIYLHTAYIVIPTQAIL